MSARAHSTRPPPRGNARAKPAVVKVAGTRSGARSAQRRKASARALTDRGDLRADVAGTSSREASISTVARLVIVIHEKSPSARSRSAVVRAAERAGTTSIGGGDDRAGRHVGQGSLTNDADWSAGLRDDDRPAASGPGRAGFTAHPTSTWAWAKIRSAPWAMSDFAASAAASSGVPALGADAQHPVAVGGGDHRRRAGSDPRPRWRTRPRGSEQPPPEPPHQGPLGVQRAVADRIVQDPKHADRLLVVVAGLHREAALPGRRHHRLERQRPGVRQAPVPAAPAPPRPGPGRPPPDRPASAAACRRCRGCPRHRTAGTPPSTARAGAGWTCRSRRRARARRGCGRSGRRRDRRAAAPRRS